MRRLVFLIRKEFISFRRNKFLPRLIFVFPIVIMLIVPLVSNMEVRGVRVAVVDEDGSQMSHVIVSHIEACSSLSIVLMGQSYREALSSLEQGRVDVIVSLPPDMERLLMNGLLPKIRIDANSVNSTKSAIGTQYVVAAITSGIAEMGVIAMASDMARITSVRYFYNETLDYRHYMIPAFIIIIVLLVCCFIPALNLVSEKEKGTIEQINVTPVTRMEFTLSKLIPYWLIGIVVLTEAILTVGVVYGLWPTGSVGAIYLAAMLFAFAMSGFAIAVANISDTMQQCIFVLFFFIMLFMLMSGLLTPLSSMPQWAQWLTVMFPPRWFVQIMRAVYLRGTTIVELSSAYWALTALAMSFGVLAAVSYRKQS